MKCPLCYRDVDAHCKAEHIPLFKEREAFFVDLTVHSEEELLARMYVAVQDEIHGEPGDQNISEGRSHRPTDQGGLVWELKRRLALRREEEAELDEADPRCGGEKYNCTMRRSQCKAQGQCCPKCTH